MDPITQQAVLATAGAAGGDKVYVDDVFSTFLYTGTGSAQTITNGIDLSGEGGLVWIKNRSSGGTYTNHAIVDSERVGSSGYKTIYPNLTAAQFDPADANSAVVTTFNSNGFTTGGNANISNSGGTYASWSFRKAPGFFDVVTYTGDGNATKTINHSLGSVPGMIIVKKTSGSGNWITYHRSTGTSKWLLLNTNDASQNPYGTWPWHNTTPTSTQFTVSLDGSGSLSSDDYKLNLSGETYVAYVFAHDEPVFGTNEDESIIKCGSYTATNASGNFVNLGFEPQWVLTKHTSRSADWTIWDNMRGINTGSTNDRGLHPNKTDAEYAPGDVIDFNATGFTLNNGSDLTNWNNGETYIYMAIRRPNKPPTAATEVFTAATQAGSSGNQGAFRSGFVVDMVIKRFSLTGSANNSVSSRFQQGYYVNTNSNAAEDNDGDNKFDYMDGWNGESASSSNKFSWMFKRAPGFMDVVAYTGTGSARNQAHNLGVAPELVIVKARTGQYPMNWHVGPFTPGYSNGYLYLNTDMGPGGNQSNYLPSVSSSTFGVTTDSGVNGSGYTYVAYLFATLPGISKVGSYTGTGNAINVDCGFSSGARFILIKRTDATGDWYAWNSSSGIVSGNDPYILLNSNAAEVTSTDYIDPLTSGFTVTSSAPAALNASGGTYIFLAIA